MSRLGADRKSRLGTDRMSRLGADRTGRLANRPGFADVDGLSSPDDGAAVGALTDVPGWGFSADRPVPVVGRLRLLAVTAVWVSGISNNSSSSMEPSSPSTCISISDEVVDSGESRFVSKRGNGFVSQ